MKYAIAIVILLAGLASASTVTMNLAVRIGGDANNTLHINGTDYNTSDPQDVIFTNLDKKYASVNRSDTIAALVPAGKLLSTRINTTYYKNIANASTLLYLHLDNNTLDSGGKGNNGTNNGANCGADGIVDNACSFDGINDYINVTKINELETGDFTISMWVKTSSTSVSGLFSQYNGSSHVIAVSMNAAGQVSFETFEGGSADINDDLSINNGQWHHVAVAKSGTTGLIYVDGQFRVSGTVATVSATEDTRIGMKEGFPFGGTIDEVFITGYAMSSVEIRDLYAFRPWHVSAEMTQETGNNRFLIAATKGTHSDVEGKLGMVESIKMVSSTFGKFLLPSPSSFTNFIRLEYADIDITNAAAWSGIGQLIIKNAGRTSRNIPNVTIEVIR